MLQHRAMTAAALEGEQRYVPSLVGSESSDTSTVNVPSGAQAGDFILLYGIDPDLRAGWTEAFNGTNLDAHYTFLPDPVPSSYTFTNMDSGILMVFRNVDSSNPLDVDPPPTITSTNTSPSISTTEPNCTIVLGLGSRVSEDAPAPDAPSGYNLAKTQYDEVLIVFGASLFYWLAAAYTTAPIASTDPSGAPYTPTAWRDSLTGSDYSALEYTAGTIALRGAIIA